MKDNKTISESQFAGMCEDAWHSCESNPDNVCVMYSLMYRLREWFGSDDPGEGVIRHSDDPPDYNYVAEINRILSAYGHSFDHYKYINELRQKVHDAQERQKNHL